ncbi:DNA mismatch repair protein MutL [Pseudoxanthobacter soli DSM 19599]|uniref:DNA mismatch repair protein MutL n=1 Tax=Pseudoxanthobacter soli DSM 19599 TaxID=1123029 RepID=A0A1M7ZHH4_9HYPH|nr:DNA mismatch repair endonuclease MutL [Pseudoxanthobacter soli]SHO64324.1 DNA mismatch repair protein MutL [Pseudoxanthobacter soli DSM 19599]
MAVIRQLDDGLINRIAAGEVIERPASVVKELVENAIDAGAHRIEIVTAAGGKTLIRVVDDGRGMSEADLALAVERHCTSKLPEGDLMSIATLGFRGEALPSIGAVARLSIASRTRDAEHAAEIVVEGGEKSAPRPVALNPGTRVEVADLFFSTPARLKFLKTDRAEATAVTEIVRRLAIAVPEVAFTLTGSDRSATEWPARSGIDARARRIADTVGAEFIDNALIVDAGREGIRLEGFAGLPSYTRAAATQQYLFVNGRPVRDRMLMGALRGAYADVMARDRHPAAVLFLTLDPHEVDVNVHPTKADVRFRDPGLVRGLIVGAIRETIGASPHRATTTGTSAAIAAFRPGAAPAGAASPAARFGFGSRAAGDWRQSMFRPLDPAGGAVPAATPPVDPIGGGLSEGVEAPFKPAYDPAALESAVPQAAFGDLARPSADARADSAVLPPERESFPLGAPRAQIHSNYIIAQTAGGMVIVDQHAAHERLVYERLKAARAAHGVERQMLLVPEIVDLPAEDVDRLAARAEEIEGFGLSLEAFGPGAVAVREVPALLGTTDVAALVRDLADEIAEWDRATGLEERLNRIASTMACHGSVRSGRRMRVEEMDALLREMEATPNSGTCNHGRPTFITLTLADIERLFGRR